jgi:hypothetical protein
VPFIYHQFKEFQSEEIQASFRTQQYTTVHQAVQVKVVLYSFIAHLGKKVTKIRRLYVLLLLKRQAFSTTLLTFREEPLSGTI